MHSKLGRAFALALLVGAAAAVGFAEDGIKWGADLAAAKKTAGEAKKLIQLNFWAEW